jgi:hypothetical protein
MYLKFFTRLFQAIRDCLSENFRNSVSDHVNLAINWRSYLETGDNRSTLYFSIVADLKEFHNVDQLEVRHSQEAQSTFVQMNSGTSSRSCSIVQ